MLDRNSASRLYASVSNDVRDRTSWREDQRKSEHLRLCDERRKRLPYPGAPDLNEPLIDDNVVQLTSSAMTILWSAKELATFMPLDAEAHQYKRYVERGFDTMLRSTLNVRAKIENLIDTHYEKGMGVAKMTLNRTALPGQTLPDFEPIHPVDVVVPTGTRRMADAERVCHIIRYTEVEFREAALREGWDSDAVDALLGMFGLNGDDSERGMAGYSRGTEDDSNDEYGVTRSKIANSESDNSVTEIVVWEVYHKVRGEENAYRAFKTVMCPDHPTEILSDVPWKWPDEQTISVVVGPEGEPITQIEVITGEDRPWPFVQFRYENRSLQYYDTRGVSKKLEDSQKEASANKTAKAVVMDYMAKPFTQGSAGLLRNFKWRPGDNLPPGVELVIPPRVDPIYDYNVDLARAAAARRVGSPQGSMSSVDKSKEAKTATEVAQTSLQNNMLSSDGVERVCEPLGQMFNMMWEYLRHFPPQGLPAAMGNGNVELVPPDAFEKNYLLVPGVSGKHANVDLMLRQAMMTTQAMASVPQAAQFIRGDEYAKFLFDMIDPRLTPVMVADPQGGTAPIEQMLAQVVQMLQGQNGQDGLLGQVQRNTQYLAQQAQIEQAEMEEEDQQAKMQKRVTNRAALPVHGGGM